MADCKFESRAWKNDLKPRFFAAYDVRACPQHSSATVIIQNLCD